jgi:CRP/FNR family cyclic AMP-dependent transcriptional regulator
MAQLQAQGHDGKQRLDTTDFPACAGLEGKAVQFNPKNTLFLQGDSADSVFYLQRGRIKISVVSAAGEEATIRLVSAGDFFGEKAMEAEPGYA